MQVWVANNCEEAVRSRKAEQQTRDHPSKLPMRARKKEVSNNLHRLVKVTIPAKRSKSLHVIKSECVVIYTKGAIEN